MTSEGKPLPGVTVTVASPALQGTRAKVTGANGGYYFLALPPGDYTFTFELEGLAPIKQELRLALAQTGRADAQMGVSGVKEAVTSVSGESTPLTTPLRPGESYTTTFVSTFRTPSRPRVSF